MTALKFKFNHIMVAKSYHIMVASSIACETKKKKNHIMVAKSLRYTILRFRNIIT